MLEYPPAAGRGRPIDLRSCKTVGQRGRAGESPEAPEQLPGLIKPHYARTGQEGGKTMAKGSSGSPSWTANQQPGG